VIHKRQVSNYGMWGQIQRELQICSSIVHPSINRMLAYFWDVDKL